MEVGMLVKAYEISVESIARERERAGSHERMRATNALVRTTIQLRDLGEDDCLVEVLFVAAEHNILHAALGSPVNIAEARGGSLVPGNCAVFRVLKVGDRVIRWKEGDIAISHCNGEPDSFGLPLRIWGYDMPHSVGWYATHAIVGSWQLIPAPLACGLSIEEIAALPLRAPTAYAMWERAYGILRVTFGAALPKRLNVLTFGGGVSECFAQLAHSNGHTVYFCSGSVQRRNDMQSQGMISIDQHRFNRFASKEDRDAFKSYTRTLAEGGMHIVADLHRGTVYDVGLSVLARGGVNVSAGWQLGPEVRYNSAQLSVRQISLVHTHYARVSECVAATEMYGIVFRPTIHPRVFTFDTLPDAFDAMQDGATDGTPIIQIATELPSEVEALRFSL
jgi:NADPH:quinone reductase-like Zn-dependent oxidoreductase